jgi:hypothetical protein
MKMFLPNIFTICFELLRVVERKEFRDNERRMHRDSLILKINEDLYNSLHCIAKLPQDINPANTNKICSYIPINE